MQLTKNLSGSTLTIAVDGRIDTTTAPVLENELKESLNDSIDSLIIDFEKLAYISSAGLRVLLSAQKAMNKQGKMVVKNVSEEVNEVFEITGFCDILTIE
ncbi:MAG: STAS domain-containing protein [Clostridia bacterium]|nr:STAS domain-containing protein [Clostridia bacterium]